MRTHWKKLLVLTLVLALAMTVAQSAMACTILAVGKDATVDGSTIVAQTDDSSSADFRLWIIPSMAGGEDEYRDLVVDSHNYGDYGDYPNTVDYGNGYAVTTIAQEEDTYAYLHSRYSFINEVGVAMGESTFSISTKTEYGTMVKSLLYDQNVGLIDCWNAQDIALERASTALEAVLIMGDLIETYGWKDNGETINICDGEEVWIFEAYGETLWAAFRLPDDAYFVAANRARITEFDFDDPDNFLCSANLKSFAIENELWSEESGEAFSPADIYAPNADNAYAYRREWRAMDLVAPSYGLDPEEDRQPLYVIPDEKVSVQDIFLICGDYYEGTEYDASLTAYAGDYGNPLNVKNPERTINLFRTCYTMIGHINSAFPDEVKSLVWYGYGAADSTFMTPLWASMTELPELYTIGSRYEDFDRESGWWICSYVQQIATTNYDYCIEIIHDRRDDRMATQYEEVAALQVEAAAMVEAGDSEGAVAMLTEYACANAEEWFEIWLDLGDELMSDVMWQSINMSHPGYSDWYTEIMNSASMKPVEEEVAE